MKSGSEPFIGKPYGNPDRPGGRARRQRRACPRGARSSTDQEVNDVVCYERVVLVRPGPGARERAPTEGSRSRRGRPAGTDVPPTDAAAHDGARRRRRSGRRRRRLLARHRQATTSWSSRSKTFPREKTCGDGLTPRAVHQLHDMGLAERSGRLPPLRRPAGHRPRHHARARVARAPRPARRYGYVVRRRDLDQIVAENAVTAGRDAAAGRRGDRAGDRPGLRARRGRARQGRRSRGDRGAATSSSPTARTAGSAGRSARPATARTRRAWPSAATTRARCTPTRGSSPRSTSRTATATRCPATAGSSPSATAR